MREAYIIVTYEDGLTANGVACYSERSPTCHVNELQHVLAEGRGEDYESAVRNAWFNAFWQWDRLGLLRKQAPKGTTIAAARNAAKAARDLVLTGDMAATRRVAGAWGETLA